MDGSPLGIFGYPYHEAGLEPLLTSKHATSNRNVTKQHLAAGFRQFYFDAWIGWLTD